MFIKLQLVKEEVQSKTCGIGQDVHLEEDGSTRQGFSYCWNVTSSIMSRTASSFFNYRVTTAPDIVPSLVDCVSRYSTTTFPFLLAQTASVHVVLVSKLHQTTNSFHFQESTKKAIMGCHESILEVRNECFEINQVRLLPNVKVRVGVTDVHFLYSPEFPSDSFSLHLPPKSSQLDVGFLSQLQDTWYSCSLVQIDYLDCVYTYFLS